MIMRRFLRAVLIVLTLVGTVVLAATLIAAHDPARGDVDVLGVPAQTGDVFIRSESAARRTTTRAPSCARASRRSSTWGQPRTSCFAFAIVSRRDLKKTRESSRPDAGSARRTVSVSSVALASPEDRTSFALGCAKTSRLEPISTRFACRRGWRTLSRGLTCMKSRMRRWLRSSRNRTRHRRSSALESGIRHAERPHQRFTAVRP